MKHGPFEYVFLVVGTIGFFIMGYDTLKEFETYKRSGDIVEKNWLKTAKYILKIIGSFIAGVFCVIAIFTILLS